MGLSTEVTIERLDGPAAVGAEGDFRRVYAEVFAEPPYEEGEEEVAVSFRRFRAQCRADSFAGAVARGADGEPVGMAYGRALGHDAVWWDHLTVPVAAAMRREDGRRTFGVMELAVRAPWRRRGVARRLHAALFQGNGAERALLNVHQDNAAAVAAYRAWGYRKVGESRPWAGADLHDVMVLELR
ncbi:GNAT family N-acetyltransferase [Streptomyces sp. NPDC057638]|uniref:GNAT family N-acetyltransferase n=1 Tax=Streptomyces sp. NPDC057638 TaxID=3346190 RepID=UPI0036BB49DC